MPSRLDRLREAFDAGEVEAIAVTRRANVRYLCGFSGSSCALLVTAKEAILFTDSRYTLQAREEAPGTTLETVAGAPLGFAVAAAAPGARVGFEAEDVTVAAHGRAEAAAHGRRMVPTTGVVEKLRAVKEAEEIRRIEAAVSLNEAAFEAGVEAVIEGAAEREIAAAIEHRMRRLGAEAPAFESIIASGPRGALPHARAGERHLKAGEPVVVDIGAMLQGYASDMTRTVFLGDAGPEGRRVHEAVSLALRRATEVVRAGAPISQVDAAARDAISEAGFGTEAYQHGTGHGVGLEVHEAPKVGRGSGGALEAGMVITIEPGIYVPGWGGVRIEDMVVVEGSGCRLLTRTPKEILTV